MIAAGMEVGAMGDTAEHSGQADPHSFALPFKPELTLSTPAPTLQTLHSDLAAGLSRALSEHLATAVQIDATLLDHIRYEEFIASLSSPTCLSTLRIDPPGAQACLDLPPAILFPMIGTLLGGVRTRDVEVPCRTLTQIEQGLALGIVERVAGQLADKLSGIEPVTVREEGLAGDPAQIRLMPNDEVLTVMRFQVTIGQTHGELCLGLPQPVAEMYFAPPMSAAASNPLPSRPQASPNLLQSVAELRVLLAETKLRLDEVLSLQEGDLITTDVPVDAPVALRFEKQDLRFGHLVEFRGQRAVEIGDRRPTDGGAQPS